MKLIVGLGNPGLKYRNTRHNAGFMVVEAFADKCGIRVNKRSFKGMVGEGVYRRHKIMLLFPQNFMNISGESVAMALGLAEGLHDLLVVYDDIDLMLGNIRFRAMGSSGGHKGMQSIIEEIGSSDFPRLRIGIRPGNDVRDTADFVLRMFSQEEKSIFEEVAERAIEGIGLWITEGVDKCMTLFNIKNSKY